MGRLQVVLIEGRHLEPINSIGYNDPGCIVSVGHQEFKVFPPAALVEKRKSTDVKWHKTLEFNVSDATKERLLFEVVDFEHSAVPSTIGSVEVSFSSLQRGVELIAWYKLVGTLRSDIKIGLTAIDFDPRTQRLKAEPVDYSFAKPRGSPPIRTTPSVDDMLGGRPSFNKPAPRPAPSHASQKMQSPAQNRAQSNGPPPALIQFQERDLKREWPHLAKGSYGVVFKGHCTGFKETVVIKDIEMAFQNSFVEWKKEINLMRRTKNPYVVDVYGYCTGKYLSIVMEYMPNGSLYDLIHKNKQKLSVLQRMRMGRHCALGLAHIHSNGVIHRDVKSMNILVSNDLSCKYTDFGTAKLIGGHTQQRAAHLMHTQNSGTPLWMAPEVKRGQSYDYSADIYSLGLVIYELFELKLPHYDQMRQSVSLPAHFQSSTIVLPCVNLTPQRRPLAREVVYRFDKLVRVAVSSVMKNLSVSQQKQILGHEVSESTQDDDLTKVYHYLLVQKPEYVDSLVNKSQGASGISGNTKNNHNHNPKPSRSSRVPPANQRYKPSFARPAANQYARGGYAQKPAYGQPHTPSFARPYSAPTTPAYQGNFGRPYVPRQQVPPQQVPQGRPAFPTQGYGAPQRPAYVPSGYGTRKSTASVDLGNRSVRSASAPKVYSSSITQEQMRMLTYNLRALSVSDLKTMCKSNNVSTSGCIQKEDIVEKLAQQCPSQALAAVKAKGNNELSRFRNRLKLQAVSGKGIKSDAVYSIIEKYLRGKMDAELLRDLVQEECASLALNGYVSEENVLVMYKRFKEMSSA